MSFIGVSTTHCEAACGKACQQNFKSEHNAEESADTSVLLVAHSRISASNAVRGKAYQGENDDCDELEDEHEALQATVQEAKFLDPGTDNGKNGDTSPDKIN